MEAARLTGRDTHRVIDATLLRVSSNDAWNSPLSVRIRRTMSRVPLDQILELPTTERVEIAQVIWESVFEHPEDVLVTQAQKDELERRWRTFEQNPDEGESWDDVKRSLLNE